MVYVYKLPLFAVPMERQRINKQGYCYTPKKSRQYVKDCRLLFSVNHQGKIIESACKVEIIVFKKREPTNKNYGDCDNLAKSILDSMTGIVFKDDCLVTELIVKKYYSSAENLIIVNVSVD